MARLHDLADLVTPAFAVTSTLEAHALAAYFFLNGGLTSRQSKMQSCAADSSTEVEYISSAKAGHLRQWLRQLVPDLGTSVKSAAAAKWAEGLRNFAKRQHVHRSY